ncbi:MAG: type I-E CRISPR-associated protein Cse2/CasB [Ectothiorhodospiraceae bacterium]|nr:type I-E CRISPR-associated protein Cse2/CasB [Ectothiorhodospiraceae bacterium]
MSQTFTEGFVQYLQGMKSDRGKLAILRKGLIENQAQATWPLLSRFLNFDKPYQMKALQTVAGLFAHHPKNTNTGNFGKLCYQLLDSDEKQKMAKGELGPISRNFQYALAANGDEIFARVKRLVLRAKRDEIPVNYVQLAQDILNWNSYKKEKIKLEWGKQFWMVSAGEETVEAVSEGNSDD